MQDNIDTSKRKFLKKAAYSAPVIVGLGSLTTVSARLCPSKMMQRDGKFERHEERLGNRLDNLDPSAKNYQKKYDKIGNKLAKTENKHARFDAKYGINHD